MSGLFGKPGIYGLGATVCAGCAGDGGPCACMVESSRQFVRSLTPNRATQEARDARIGLHGELVKALEEIARRHDVLIARVDLRWIEASSIDGKEYGCSLSRLETSSR